MKNKINNNSLNLDSIDAIILNQERSSKTINGNGLNKKYSITSNENPVRNNYRKIKTLKLSSSNLQKSIKNSKCSINQLKSKHTKNKKVKFNNKIDIIKVECWKRYNLEQTGKDWEDIDGFCDFSEKGKNKTKENSNKKDNIKDNNKDNNTNINNDNTDDINKKNTNKNKNKRNKKEKNKKGNYTCVCCII